MDLSDFNSVVRQDEVAREIFRITCARVRQMRVRANLGFSSARSKVAAKGFFVIAESLCLFLLGFATSRCRFGPVSLLNSFYGANII